MDKSIFPNKRRGSNIIPIPKLGKTKFEIENTTDQYR